MGEQLSLPRVELLSRPVALPVARWLRLHQREPGRVWRATVECALSRVRSLASASSLLGVTVGVLVGWMDRAKIEAPEWLNSEVLRKVKRKKTDRCGKVQAAERQAQKHFKGKRKSSKKSSHPRRKK